jgi:hypothetical protein
VTQQLAGHSDIHTTQSYYLPVQADGNCSLQESNLQPSVP